MEDSKPSGGPQQPQGQQQQQAQQQQSPLNPLEAQVQEQLNRMWREQLQEIENMSADPNEFKNHQLPLARIKKIMKSDEDVRMIASEAPIIFAKACELFVMELTWRAWACSEDSKRKTLQRQDVGQAIANTEMFDFLLDMNVDQGGTGSGGGGANTAGPSNSSVAQTQRGQGPGPGPGQVQHGAAVGFNRGPGAGSGHTHQSHAQMQGGPQAGPMLGGPGGQGQGQAGPQSYGAFAAPFASHAPQQAWGSVAALAASEQAHYMAAAAAAAAMGAMGGGAQGPPPGSGHGGFPGAPPHQGHHQWGGPGMG